MTIARHSTFTGAVRVRPDRQSASYDSYGRLRVTDPAVQYDARFINDLNPLTTATDTASGGTITRNTNTSSAELNVTTTDGSKALLQSKEYHHYVPGRTVQFYLAALFSSNSADRTQRLGAFSDDDGLFFEYEDSTLYVVTRTSVSGSPVDTRVAQSSWNIDPMDGTGPSGINLDPEKIQTYICQYQWHGTGTRTWGLAIENRIYYVHQEQTANVGGDPWSTSGDVPIRAEVINTATAANSATLKLQSMAVLTEGAEFSAIQSHAISASSERSIGDTTFEPLISVRLKSDYTRATLQIEKAPVISTSNDPIEVRILLNPTLTGASWTSAGTNAIFEYDEDATAVSGGEILDLFYLTEEGTNEASLTNTLLKVLADYSGTRDILTVAVKSVDTNASVTGGVVMREIF